MDLLRLRIDSYCYYANMWVSYEDCLWCVIDFVVYYGEIEV